MSEETKPDVAATAEATPVATVEATAVETVTEPAVKPAAEPSFIDRLKQLIADGSQQRLVLHTGSGNTPIDISLPLGLAITGFLFLVAPFLAIIISLGIWLSRARLIVTPGSESSQPADYI